MIKKIKDNLWQMIFEESFGGCAYLLKTEHKNILIDTGSESNTEELKKFLKRLHMPIEQIDIVLLTHDHWDHAGNINMFPNAEMYYPIELHNSIPEIKTIKIIKTPGHTEDSVCFRYKDVLFSGDTLFHEGYIGRTDFPESRPEQMQESQDKLKKIRYEILCPGHLL